MRTNPQTTEPFKAFPEFQFKTVTVLLVIIGWPVTSGGGGSAQALGCAHFGEQIFRMVS